jgi:hypothetical protein
MTNQLDLRSRTAACVLSTKSGITSAIQHQFYRLAFNLARRIAVDRHKFPPMGGTEGGNQAAFPNTATQRKKRSEPYDHR